MWNPQLKQYIAETAVTPNLIVKPGSTDDYVVLGAAAADKLMGVSGNVGGIAGERVDIIKEGIADVIAGGTITRGDPITADAAGKAVVAAPSAGTNARIIGFAEVSGVTGDVITVLLSPGVMQG
jgi:hypothetical protein